MNLIVQINGIGKSLFSSLEFRNKCFFVYMNVKCFFVQTSSLSELMYFKLSICNCMIMDSVW